jgi:DegV family protein with EDD domain
MGFIISSDSCCDSFKSYLKANNAFYLPMSYIINDVPYFDDFDSAEQYRNFYDGLRSGKMPKTAQANTFETAEYFEKLLNENDGDIVHLALSSGLSNTAINAEAAAKEVMQKYPDRKVYAIDSLSATQGQMYLVDRALEMREAGMSAEQTAEELKLIARRLHHFVLVKDLFHLKRGGRVSSAAAMIGTVLNIRPILIINHKGQLVVINKEKGVTKSLKYLTKSLNKNIKEGEIRAYIAHADDIETAEDLKNMLIEEGITDVKIGYIGPVIGSHTGPGAIGLVFEGEKRFTIEQK